MLMRPGVIVLAPAVGMIRILGAVCGEMRREQKLAATRIGYNLRGGKGKSESAIFKFERGEHQPEALDELVAAYAYELEMSESAIWAIALERLRVEEKSPSEQAADAVARAARSRSDAPGRKQPSTRTTRVGRAASGR